MSADRFWIGATNKMKKLKLLKRILFQLLQNQRAILNYLHNTNDYPTRMKDGMYYGLKRNLFACKEDTDCLIDEMREVFRK